MMRRERVERAGAAHLVQALDEVAMDSYMNVEVWMLVVQVERESFSVL